MALKYWIALTVVALSPCLLAQAGSATAQKSKKSLPSGYVHVELVLDNEAVFKGLADKTRLVEVVKRHKYVKLDKSEKSRFGAGIRLWFYDGLQGFLFFQYRHIDKVVVGHELSAGQLDKLRLAATEKKIARQAAVVTKKALAPASSGAGQATVILTASEKGLLNRWSPDKGWNEAKFEDIQKRIITEGYEPTAEESEWAKAYPDWLKALKKSRTPVAKSKKPVAKLVSQAKSNSEAKKSSQPVPVTKSLSESRNKKKRRPRRSQIPKGESPSRSLR